MRLFSTLLALLYGFAVIAAEPRTPLPRVDVNNASPAMLETLPGVGPKLAQEIIAGRPFRTLTDLDRVKGIGPKKLEQLRHRILIGPGTNRAAGFRAAPSNQPVRINLNTATQAELETLPGVGPKRAEAILAKRPFKRVEELMAIAGLKGAQFDRIKPLVTAP